MLGYSWRMHDGKWFGVQELEEPAYTVKTEFVKRPGGQHGGDWTARITMTPKVMYTGVKCIRCEIQPVGQL
jgi:mannosyl-oligosaccharide glucosidase